VIVFTLLRYFEASALLLSIVMVVLALAGSIVCIKCASAVIAETGDSDPAQLVADEFAGQALTFIGIAYLLKNAVSKGEIWLTALLGLLLFRTFDIVKPWPIRESEKLPKGWGVLADDLLAGIYATIALIICIRLRAVCYAG
jgi:phosphatidylglycerophosphatase A